MVEGLPIQHTIAYYNGGTVEVFKCPSCGKLIRSSDVELFKHIHRMATYIILGECPYCKHKFQPEPITMRNSDVKTGISIFQNYPCISVWQNEYRIIKSGDNYTTISEFEVYKLSLKSRHITYRRYVNGKLVKKSVKFNMEVSLFYVDLTDELKEFLGLPDELYPKDKVYNAYNLLDSLRYADIKVNGMSIVGNFTKQQTKKLNRLVREKGKHLSSKDFLLKVVLYGGPTRYIEANSGNIPHKQLWKELLKYNLRYVYRTNGGFQFLFRLSQYTANLHDILYYIKLINDSRYGSPYTLIPEFIVRLHMVFNPDRVKQFIKDNESSFIYDTTEEGRLAMDTMNMLVQIPQREFTTKVVPYLKDYFNHHKLSMKRLHDELAFITMKLNNDYIEYEYTKAIKERFGNVKVGQYKFELPSASTMLRLHSAAMRNCAYSIYKDKHNDSVLIVMMLDSIDGHLATLKIEPKFSEVPLFQLDRPDIKFKLTEAKARLNIPVKEFPELNEAVVEFCERCNVEIATKDVKVKTGELIKVAG
jgi:hypothetical protein